MSSPMVLTILVWSGTVLAFLMGGQIVVIDDYTHNTRTIFQLDGLPIESWIPPNG